MNELGVSLRDLVDAALADLSGKRWAVGEAEPHVPARPGLYAIYGDETAWSELELDPAPTAPLYIGKAERSLASRDLDGHFALRPSSLARTGSSTVRRSFAALLKHVLDLRGMPRNPAEPERFANYGLAGEGDLRLNAWMRSRLSLAIWEAPAAMPAPLRLVEAQVIAHFAPPMNIAGNPRKLVRLSRARAEMASEARAFTGS